MALIENIQREDLNPLEEASGIQRLIDEFGLTHEAAPRRSAARARGHQPAAPARACAAGAASCSRKGASTWATRARCSRCRGAADRACARSGRDKRLSVREVEQRCRSSALQGARRREARASTAMSRACRKNGRERLGTTVQIKPRAQSGGKLVIDYSSLDELIGCCSV